MKIVYRFILTISLLSSCLLTSCAYHWLRMTSDTSEAVDQCVVYYEDIPMWMCSHRKRDAVILRIPGGLPDSIKVSSMGMNGTSHDKTYNIQDDMPSRFRNGDSFYIIFHKDAPADLYYSLKVEQFRMVRIRYNESEDEKLKRELNESLLKAAVGGYQKTIAKLLQQGADIDYLSDCASPTALRRALNNGHYEIAKYLLRNGAQASEKDLSADYLQPFWGQWKVEQDATIDRNPAELHCDK